MNNKQEANTIKHLQSEPNQLLKDTMAAKRKETCINPKACTQALQKTKTLIYKKMRSYSFVPSKIRIFAYLL